MGEKFGFLDGIWDQMINDVRNGGGISGAAKKMDPAQHKYVIMPDDEEYRQITHKKEDFYSFTDDERVIPGAGKSVVKDDSSVHSVEDADALIGNPVLIDADGFVFQRRNGEWFMAGAAFGSTEFSGNFPARKLVEK